ncbi:MAG: histone deacetylase family protein [Elusimicrobiota bacterium]
MKPVFIYSPRYAVPMNGHAFPTQKFALTAELLAARGKFIAPELPSRDDLALAHDSSWIDKVTGLTAMSPADEALCELPFSPEISIAHQLSASGAILACRRALETGVGLHVGGGSHHAFRDHGEGFCLVNDIACGILKMRREGRIARAAVIDLDVHQGNGTAAIFSDDPGVFTFSMHQSDLYPEIKTPGSMDVALRAGTADAEYLGVLENRLPAVFKANPELVVYQAGVDCAAGDLLGGLSLSPGGLAARDRLVFEHCKSRRIPVAVALGGGYRKDLEQTAKLHAQTLEIFARMDSCSRKPGKK